MTDLVNLFMTQALILMTKFPNKYDIEDLTGFMLFKYFMFLFFFIKDCFLRDNTEAACFTRGMQQKVNTEREGENKIFVS